MEGTQKEHPVSAVRVTAHPLLLPPRLCVLVAVERMFLLPSLYHRGLGRQPSTNVIANSLETTKQTEKIYFHFGALGL